TISCGGCVLSVRSFGDPRPDPQSQSCRPGPVNLRAFIGLSDDTSGALTAARACAAGFLGVGCKIGNSDIAEDFARLVGRDRFGAKDPRTSAGCNEARLPAICGWFRRHDKNSGMKPRTWRDFLHKPVTRGTHRAAAAGDGDRPR